MDILYFLTAAFIVLAGLAVYFGARLTRERNYLRRRLVDEKASSEILLKELHRVTKEDNETLKLFREDLAEFTVERDVAVARAGALERDKAKEVEIRIGFQSKVYGLEQERDNARLRADRIAAQLKATDEELGRKQEHVDSLRKLYDELAEVTKTAAPRRDASGRFQKRAC